MTEAKKFDPFNDRLSRDLRNDLSSLFITELGDGDLVETEEVSARYLAREDLSEPLRDYIRDRMLRYRQVLADSRSHKDPFMIAALFWNQRLFFEMHEFLEDIWMESSGDSKLILQALIRAAGSYLLHDGGRDKGAEKMAARSVSTLTSLKDQIPLPFEYEKLAEGLNDLAAEPPFFSIHGT